MKIIFLVSSLNSGGAERVATTLCNAWSLRGDHVTIVTTYFGAGKPFYPVATDVDLIFLDDFLGNYQKTLLGCLNKILVLRNIILNKKPDVIISFLSNVNVAAILSSRFSTIPVVCCERSNLSRVQISFFLQLACRATYWLADMLVVQTESALGVAKKIYPWLKALRAVPNPVQNHLVSSVKSNKVAAKKILLSLGRLVEDKQVAIAIKIYSKLACCYPDWVFHIYGDGPERSCLENLILSLNLQDFVFLKGATTEPLEVMAGADAFIMTSKYEGFPNALLEAMSSGLPCVIFDCPYGPSDITRKGQDAFLVPLNDESALEAKLDELMRREELRMQMGKQARESVLARYGLLSVLEQWDLIFTELGLIK